MAVEAGEYEIGPDNADLLVRTTSAGVAGAMGHDLTLLVGSWSGTLTIAEDPADCGFTLDADLRSLEVVAGRGGAKPLSDGDKAEVVKNAQKALQTSRHPTLSVESTDVDGDWDAATVTTDLTLHGVTKPVEVEVEQPEPGSFSATATLRQSDFGIKPFSAMLGALKIADEVTVEASLEF